MASPSKKLTLTREAVRTLKIRTNLRTGFEATTPVDDAHSFLRNTCPETGSQGTSSSNRDTTGGVGAKGLVNNGGSGSYGKYLC
jgi:hypothetical protein